MDRGQEVGGLSEGKEKVPSVDVQKKKDIATRQEAVCLRET